MNLKLINPIGFLERTCRCFGSGKDRFSSKGVNKKNNDINKDKYLHVILSKRSGSGVNRGFRVIDNKMCTYVQVKNVPNSAFIMHRH